MKVSVILCTYNRCESLATALESAANLEVPPSISWEVLVVDNNSNDGTRAVAGSYCERFPGRFRYLFEPRPGKSNALNAGIQAANADVLAFMDDDVVVESSWLKNLTAPLEQAEWAGSGGRILPEKKFVPPQWLSTDGRYALAPLAMFDYGSQACELREAPFGTNMAFRKTVFEKYGGFRTDLGPRPGSEIRSEDTEFGRRLLDAGEHLFYEPAAVVYHSVSEKRLRPAYFLKWWFDKARADTRAYGVESGAKLYIGRVPAYLFRRLAVWTLRWWLTFNPKRRFSCKIKVWSVAGVIAECRNKSEQVS